MTDSKHEPVLIAGSGAMACLFAARLSAVGVPVTMLGSWETGLEALRRRGVALVDPQVGERSYPVQAITSAQDFPGAQLALVLVKSWQTPRAARQLQECLAEDGLAVTLQNGMGNREILVEALGQERAALGVTTVGARLLGPGRAFLAGEGPVTLQEHPRIGPLADLLRLAGFTVELSPDPVALLWGKLVINAAINPLTALLDVPNGGLLERPTAHALMAEAAREAAGVAAAQGVRLPYPDPVAVAETVARRTAANRSSMLQDVRRGAPTEIDAISGAIVKVGERYSVPTPVNRTMWQLVKALEIGAA